MTKADVENLQTIDSLQHELESMQGELAKCNAQHTPPPTATSLQIGTVTVRLGMAKDAVVAALAVQYEVTDNPNPPTTPPPTRSYGIRQKDAPDWMPWVGQLFIGPKGTIVGAERFWSSGESGEEVASAVVGLFASLELEGNTTCSIGVDRFGRGLRDALVMCSNKTIRISSMEKGGSEVIEEIGSPLAAYILGDHLKTGHM